MTKKRLNDLYYKWMCNLVEHEDFPQTLYFQKLLHRLHEIEFTYIIEMDGNRASDGIALRYRFGLENGYSKELIREYLDGEPCSVLEMMVALAFRCEEHIMYDPEIGDRTGQWFWTMIVNLGLSSMDDSKFDDQFVEDVMFRFLNRRYKMNGEGGLFVLNHCKRDLRRIEIWYQLMWYLNELTNDDSN